jgi:hypothetical protein
MTSPDPKYSKHFEDLRQINSITPRNAPLHPAFSKVPRAGASASMGPGPVSPVSPVGVSCFLAGAKVLMADGSVRNVEDIVAGDLLMTVGGKSTECIEMYLPILGNRKMIEFEDKSSMWSEEHPFWTRNIKTKTQWWWIYGADTWREEVAAEIAVGLFDNNSVLTGDTSELEFATVDGWRSAKPQETAEAYDYFTQLYHPKTAGTPIIVNGYLVTGGTDQWSYDYTKLDWQGLTESVIV